MFGITYRLQKILYNFLCSIHAAKHFTLVAFLHSLRKLYLALVVRSHHSYKINFQLATQGTVNAFKRTVTLNTF